MRLVNISNIPGPFQKANHSLPANWISFRLIEGCACKARFDDKKSKRPGANFPWQFALWYSFYFHVAQTSGQYPQWPDGRFGQQGFS